MDKKYTYDFNNKKGLLSKLRSYTEVPDDDNIRFKELIRQKLIHCPELLYALHNEALKNELFQPNGMLNIDGEWDLYFGENSNIRPFIYLPQTQECVENFLCYKLDFKEAPKYNSVEKYMVLTFFIIAHGSDIIDKDTGIARHDLIGSILREYFNWSNIFGAQCHITSDVEGVTDNNYITRTMTLECTVPNGMVKTIGNKTDYINNEVRR